VHTSVITTNNYQEEFTTHSPQPINITYALTLTPKLVLIAKFSIFLFAENLQKKNWLVKELATEFFSAKNLPEKFKYPNHLPKLNIVIWLIQISISRHYCTSAIFTDFSD